MKKILVIIAILILIGVGYFVYRQNINVAKAPTAEIPLAQNVSTTAPATTTAPANKPVTSKATGTTTEANGTYSSGENGGGDMGTDISVEQVVFDGSSFAPADLTVKANDYVFFKNDSQGNFWPAYKQPTGGMAYAEFNAGKAYAPGGIFKLQFTKAGTWSYVDLLHPAIGGTITVTK